VAFGVYVHIPFCAHRCDYCDFATWTDREHLAAQYARACISDVRDHYEAGACPEATSVFFGGGTPSLIGAELLTAILAAIPRRADAEVTVECNPDTVDRAKLEAYRAAGVNRLSFGVQSMRGPVLASLGRTHDPANVVAAVAAARAAGFDNLNLDLIYGAAGESIADWTVSVEQALALEPTHVSAYALTIEAGTPLARRIAAGEVGAPDDDDQAEKYAIADDLLGRAGLEWYEISNWARPGRACRHNELYWSGGDYLGVGCAAHGHTRGRRWWTVRTPERYIDAVERNVCREAGAEVLAPEARAAEAIGLALRTRAGVDVSDDRGLVADGLAVRDPMSGRLVLTQRGRLLANAATIRLI